MFGSFLAPRLLAATDPMSSSSGASDPMSGSPADRNTGKKKQDRGGWQGGLSAAGKSLQSSGSQMMSDARSEEASRIGPVSYKRGGKVRKMKRKLKMRAKPRK